MLGSPSPRRAILALILAAASWGVGTVISKRAVDEIPPLTLLPVQLAASLVFLIVLTRWRGDVARDRPTPPILGRLGILNPGIAYALSLLGLVHISASLSVLLWTTEPLMILLLAAWLLRERIGPLLVALSMTAVAGMLLVIGGQGADGDLLGVTLTLAGIGCCAVYTVVARRWIGEADSTLRVVAAQQRWALGFAVVALVAVTALGTVGTVGGGAGAVAVSPEGWLSAIVSGVLYYGLAYWLYLSGLREVPAAFAASSFYLIPVFGVSAGYLLLGERLEPPQLLGGAVVLVSVFAIVWRGARSLSRSTGLCHAGWVRIGVVSDTHLPRFGRALPRELVSGLEAAGVELILHLGDFTGRDVPALFEALAPFDAVAGNNDGPELTDRFGRRKVITVGDGVRLGLVHGDLGAGRTTPERASGAFDAEEVEAVLFGHSHIPLVERLPDGRWLVNPGSPTDKRRQPRYSWALLETEPGGGVRPTIRLYDDRSA